MKKTRPLTHTCPTHTPGARACYIAHGCGCQPCTDAATRWKKSFDHARASGHHLTTPAPPLAAHIGRLRAAGMTLREIARDADVSPGTVRNVVEGNVARVSNATATKLAGVQKRSAGGHATVHSIGTARRLQSLAWMGWDAVALAEHLGWAPAFVRTLRRSGGRTVHAATHDRVAELWDRLALVPRTGPSADRARLKAQRLGWAPPLAWDDDDLDHLDARPHIGTARAYGHTADDIADMVECGRSLAEITASRGITADSVRTSLARRGHGDLWLRIAPRERKAS